jgi:peptidyl-prolyl cis-trans isomerase C
MLRAPVIAILALCAACGGSGPRERSSPGGALSQGVVANVDGAAITLADVRRLCERGGLTPRAALERLEAEALLASEAERRGFAAVDAVQLVGRQALVQALLEGDIESEAPTAAELDEAYAKSGARFDTPERRIATHVLAVLPKEPTPESDAAERAFAADAIRQLSAAAEPTSVLDRLQQAKVPFPIKVEALPPAPRAGAFVPEFSDALFSLEKPGIVPTPVRTKFGWHAIWLREILPEQRVPESVARAELAREIALNKQQRRLDALLKQLEQRASVTYAPKVRDALAVLEY